MATLVIRSTSSVDRRRGGDQREEDVVLAFEGEEPVDSGCGDLACAPRRQSCRPACGPKGAGRRSAWVGVALAGSPDILAWDGTDAAAGPIPARVGVTSDGRDDEVPVGVEETFNVASGRRRRRCRCRCALAGVDRVGAVHVGHGVPVSLKRRLDLVLELVLVAEHAGQHHARDDEDGDDATSQTHQR